MPKCGYTEHEVNHMFIKIHASSGDEMLVNTDNITSIFANNDETSQAKTTIWFGLANVDVMESLEDIEKMLMH